MTSEESIELFTLINLAIVGLSHFLQPKIWVVFFQFLYSKGHAGNIANALLALSVGSLIFSFHFVWHGPKVWVTLYGLVQVIKGFFYLVFPSIGLASMGKVSLENAGKFRWAGLVMFGLSILLACSLFS